MAQLVRYNAFLIKTEFCDGAKGSTDFYGFFEEN